MKEILEFLRDLENNNNREWFNSNKERYQKVLKTWYAFSESLIKEIGRFDEDIAPLTIKDCTYRIYRDTRFSRNILGKANSMFVPDMEGALKRVPREFDSNAPYADWMRMKSFCLSAITDDSFLLEDNLAQRVAELFKTTKPFIDYINRAVDFVKEEMKG